MTPAMVALVQAENATSAALMRTVKAASNRLKLRLVDGQRASVAVLSTASELEDEAALAIVTAHKPALEKADSHAREEIAAAILLALLFRGKPKNEAKAEVTTALHAVHSSPLPDVPMARLAGKALANNWAGGNMAALSRAEMIAKAEAEAAAQAAKVAESIYGAGYRVSAGIARSVPPPEVFRPKVLQIATDATTATTHEVRRDVGHRILTRFPSAVVEVVAWEWDATLDSRTCPRCDVLHGKQFAKYEDAPSIPVHSRCRCLLRPVFRKH